MSIEITARIERRTWYVDGKYVGHQSPFFADDAGITAAEMTGDFYGEWQGTRHRDGKAILEADMQREIEYRRLLLKNHPDSLLGEFYCSPCKLDNWGEYRVVTNAVRAVDLLIA
jgi:hypothetical protein